MRLLIDWWVLQGSNLRPSPCKGDALPAELSTQEKHYCTVSLNFLPALNVGTLQARI